MIRVSLSDAEKSVDSIWLWHEKAAAALRERLLQEQVASVPFTRPVFFGMSEGEIDAFFRELDYLTILDLLSAAEAALRVDFWTRVHDKAKDDLSREFRKIAKRFEEKISLEEHILGPWSNDKPEIRGAVGDFRGALKLRNWLAHGRYWTPKLARKAYSAADVLDICNELLLKMSLK